MEKDVIQRNNITAQVVDYMSDQIESGAWQVDAPIPSENTLIRELNVSRASVRSAIQYYKGIGVLKSHQGKGTYLISNDVDGETENRITAEDCKNIQQVLEFRSILEPVACEMAVRRNADAIIEPLSDCLLEMKKPNIDRTDFVSADVRFHQILCQASGNTLLYKSLNKVFLETRKNHEQMYSIFGKQLGIDYHTKILSAVRKKDPEEAYRLMKEHLETALRRLDDEKVE